MDTPRWAEILTREFPNLTIEGFEIVEQASDRYNCIAFAAGDISKWWDHNEDNYWPSSTARSDRIKSLKEVFAGLGFEQCHDSSLKSGYEKVALYEEQGVWKHAALQTAAGRWRSKMGQGPVIEHRSPASLSDGVYGNPTIYMRRATSETREREAAS